MIQIDSSLNYSYKTIRVTQSRINKGLLAIPISLIDNFPKTRTQIKILLNNGKEYFSKNFTPYNSSSRECRIGGMKGFFNMNNLKDGDELVIQILGEGKYRILTEKKFEQIIKKTELEYDTAKSEQSAYDKIKKLAEITNIQINQVIKNEFLRLSNSDIKKRKHITRSITKGKENVPISLRKLLTEVYQGKCQVSGFGFLRKDGKPYFEIHHIDPGIGNHLKNLLIVCPNVHAQFTHTNLQQQFDNEGWLRKVKFNNDEYLVIQYIDKLHKKIYKEIHDETK